MAENERREFLKTALVAMGAAGVGAMSNTSCNRQGGAILNPTREELVKRLQKLAESKPPSNLSQGAMCYSTFGPIFEEKPCPKCEQTMSVGEKDEILREYNVPLKRIQDQGIDAKLIIPEHCPECGFGLKEAKFQLEIKYPDDPVPVQVELDYAYELELMALFLQGKDRYEGSVGEEYPLKDEAKRLRELFGITETK